MADLLAYYPRAYDAFEEPVAIGQLKENSVMAVQSALVKHADLLRFNHMQVVSLQIKDLTGSLQVSWYNMPYMRANLKPGEMYVFRGRVVRKRGRLIMEQPEVFTPQAYGELVHSMQPIYGQTRGLGNKAIVKAQTQALQLRQMEREYMPATLRNGTSWRRSTTRWSTSISPQIRASCSTPENAWCSTSFSSFWWACAS